MHLLQELHAKGKTIVMVTHDGDLAEFAERIELLRDGAVIQTRAGKNHFKKY